MGLSSAGLIAEPAGSADVRRVRPGRRRDSHGRHAPRVRVLLEPDRRALGRPPPRRAHANRDPPADGLPQIPRRSRGGRSAAEHLVGALRCLYRHAEDDGLITAADNPARKVAKPRRLPSTRRAVPDNRLAEINQIAATTGNDPELDTILLRLHTETACRRGGALALRPADLDPDQCLILLREKGETQRWQPVSPTLMARLIQHGQDRHAPVDGQLLRYANGLPITSRRYDHLWTRIGANLPWVRTQQISTHWIRHTTLTWVERNFGHAIAREYAGHSDSSGDTGSTSTYVRASMHEVAAALAALTGEPHPLAEAEEA